MDGPVNLLSPENREERPRMLTIVCILTFIGSGMNLFSNLIIVLFFDSFKLVVANLTETLKLPGMEMLLQGPVMFFGALVLVYAGSLAGALLMWRLKKTGFHIYAISQILLILAPMYFFKIPAPGILDVLLAGVFILLYSMNLKVMS